MGQPYIGEIRIFGGNFAPQDWAFCRGQILAISDYDALYSLIGTTYGGDGQTTFGLPDLQGRVPIHQGQGAGLDNYALGGKGGAESVTLTSSQLPTHTHSAAAQSAFGDSNAPAGNVAAWAQATGGSRYSTNAPTGTMNAGTTVGTGGSQPHGNMPPYLGINFIISLLGVYPSQS